MAMNEAPLDLVAAGEFARHLALETWEQIAGFFRGKFDVFEKESDGPATEADILADRFILSRLGERYPASRFGYLSEETAHGPERLQREACWIIDPIDGTRDFMEGREDFAIQIGLAQRAASGIFEPVVGVVYQPAAALLYRAVRGQGAWRENLRLGTQERLVVSACRELTDCRLVITRSHMGRRLAAAMEALQPRESYTAGSLGVKVAHVSERRADLYINTSRRFCKEWDVCAPHAILAEAGGMLTDLRGNRIDYNQPDVYIEEGLVASNGHLHREVLMRLAGVPEAWAPS
jgi:3'(2'), 5'-bisphosphate nucleotidase